MTIKSKRVIFVLLAGLVLVGGMAAYLFFSFARPAGSGPAGPTIDHGMFSSAWTSRRILLVGLGDSVTAGFGARKGYCTLTGWLNVPRMNFPI
jgi:hypothetical protein